MNITNVALKTPAWIKSKLQSLAPERLIPTLGLWAFSLKNIPLIFLISPQIIKLNAHGSEIQVPLNYITKNHLRSMYFGSMAIGADLAGGALTFDKIKKLKRKTSFVFKDVKAQFLKRPEADVHFICKEGRKIDKMLIESIRSGQRVNKPILITAITPSISGQEPVAKFNMTLSVKVQ